MQFAEPDYDSDSFDWEREAYEWGLDTEEDHAKGLSAEDLRAISRRVCVGIIAEEEASGRVFAGDKESRER